MFHKSFKVILTSLLAILIFICILIQHPSQVDFNEIDKQAITEYLGNGAIQFVDDPVYGNKVYGACFGLGLTPPEPGDIVKITFSMHQYDFWGNETDEVIAHVTKIESLF